MEDKNEKRHRPTFGKSQICQMERVFLKNHYPDIAARSDLSQSTGLSEPQVQVSGLSTTYSLLLRWSGYARHFNIFSFD